MWFVKIIFFTHAIELVVYIYFSLKKCLYELFLFWKFMQQSSCTDNFNFRKSVKYVVHMIAIRTQDMLNFILLVITER